MPPDDLLPISALQHLLFCPRQCGLIHLEQVWAENRLTAAGRLLHERVHEGPAESRGGVRIVRGLRLASAELGLTGIADVVELHPAPAGTPPSRACEIPGLAGRWVPFPVEYKRGRPKPDACDRVQLCAQAICLEAMLGVTVEQGALYYGRPRRRQAVEIDEPLRRETADAARRLHELFRTGRTPPPQPSRKCRACSLKAICMPKAAARPSAAAYTRRMLAAHLQPPNTEAET